MNKFKSIWTTISGSISSIIPMFFTICKSGTCTVACVSPIASILGISSASLITSPLTQSIFPLLLVVSAVSFTVSYYKLYVLPKYATNCNSDCTCEPTINTFQQKISVWIFWVGFVASIIFFTYFEYQSYNANITAKATIKTEQLINLTNKTNFTDTIETEKPCCNGDKKCE
jgi:hypothetical protein